VGIRSAWNAIAGLLTGQGPSAADREKALADPAPTEGTHPGRIGLEGDLEGNVIDVGENITLTGMIAGRGNVIRIAGTQSPQTLNLHVFGHNNAVSIGAGAFLQNLRVEIGSSRWPCSRARLSIGDCFSIASHGRFIIPNSGNVAEIGPNCMFSNNITIRAGEYPHLIFDRESGAYLDVSDGITIGHHVWVGEGAFIGKSVTLPDDCIVGARSVVTRRFAEPHCAIAGNPARIVRRGVQWIANEFMLEDQFPAGHETFAQAQVTQINRAQHDQAATQAERDAQVSSASARSD
jgi:acetyltransferase-like isoleucine patch superfamily enzyme